MQRSKLVLILTVAFASTVSTAYAYDPKILGTKRYSIHTEVAKGSQVVSTGLKEIQNGGIAHFDDGKIKITDGTVTLFCRPRIQRTWQFHNERCEEPIRERKQIGIGFQAEIAVREASDGNILVNVQGRYVELLREMIRARTDADIHLTDLEDTSLNGSFVLQPGGVWLLRNGTPGSEITLKLSVIPI